MGISNFLISFIRRDYSFPTVLVCDQTFVTNVLTETHWLARTKHDCKGVYILHSLLNSTCSIWVLLGFGYKSFWNSFAIELEVEMRVIGFGKQNKTVTTLLSNKLHNALWWNTAIMLLIPLRCSLMIIIFYTFWLAYLFVEVSFWIFLRKGFASSCANVI